MAPRSGSGSGGVRERVRRRSPTTSPTQLRVRNRSKKATVVSLRALVGIDLELLPEGDCALKSADIRVERDDKGRVLYRVYLKSSRYKVGWVLNGCTSSCLLCDVRFGTFLRRHHCRSCGLIVCHACSKSKDLVGDLDRGSKTRICSACVQERAQEPLSPQAPLQTSVIVVSTPISIMDKVGPEEVKVTIQGEDVASIDTTRAQVKPHDDNNSNRVSGALEESTVSDVTDPHYVPAYPTSTVSPTLIRKMAEVGFGGDHNSSDDDDDETVTPIHRRHSVNLDSSPGVVEGDSFLSASGSSLGADSAQRYHLSDSSDVSPLSCSVSPIYKRRPVMRRRSSTRMNSDQQTEQSSAPQDLLADLQLEDENQENTPGKNKIAKEHTPGKLNTRKTLGEIFGLAASQTTAQNQGIVEPNFSDDDSDGEADVSASGSSLGDDSVRRFFQDSDASTAASGSSYSPNSSKDVIVHDTFHSPSFTANTKSRSYTSAKKSPCQSDLLSELDKENVSRQGKFDEMNLKGRKTEQYQSPSTVSGDNILVI